VKTGADYIASKQRYFYSLRIHIIVTEQGEPVEFFLMPGACSDTRALFRYNFDLLEHAWITGDKTYNDYTIEDVLREVALICCHCARRIDCDLCLLI